MNYIIFSISFFISVSSFGSDSQPDRWAHYESFLPIIYDCRKFDIQSIEGASSCRREILKRKIAYQLKLKKLHEQREQLFWESMNPSEAEEIRAIMSGERDDELE